MTLKKKIKHPHFLWIHNKSLFFPYRQVYQEYGKNNDFCQISKKCGGLNFFFFNPIFFSENKIKYFGGTVSGQKQILFFLKSIQSFHIGQVWFIIVFYLPLKLNLLDFSSHVPEKLIFSEICETGSEFSSSLFKSQNFYYNHFLDTPNYLSWQDKEFGVPHEHNLFVKCTENWVFQQGNKFVGHIFHQNLSIFWHVWSSKLCNFRGKFAIFVFHESYDL